MIPTWYSTRYMTASEVSVIDKLFSQPVPIVAACNRVQKQFDAKMRRELAMQQGAHVALQQTLKLRYESVLQSTRLKGLGYAILGFLGAGGAVWMVMQ